MPLGTRRLPPLPTKLDGAEFLPGLPPHAVSQRHQCGGIVRRNAVKTVRMGVRLILRFELGKMTVDENRPEMLPAIAQDERSKCKNSLTAINGPPHA